MNEYFNPISHGDILVEGSTPDSNVTFFIRLIPAPSQYNILAIPMNDHTNEEIQMMTSMPEGAELIRTLRNNLIAGAGFDSNNHIGEHFNTIYNDNSTQQIRITPEINNQLDGLPIQLTSLAREDILSIEQVGHDVEEEDITHILDDHYNAIWTDIMENLGGVLESAVGQAPPVDMGFDDIVNLLINTLSGPSGSTRFVLDNLTSRQIITYDEAFIVYPDLYEFFNEHIPAEFYKPVSVRLTKEQFDEKIHVCSMSKKIKNKLGTDDPTCTICLEDVRSRQHCAITSCNHVFHKKCAKQWFIEQCEKPLCPNCRKDPRDLLKWGTPNRSLVVKIPLHKITNTSVEV